MLRGAAGTAPRRQTDKGRRPAPRSSVGGVLALALGCAIAGPAHAQSTDPGPPRFAVTGRLHWDAAIYRRVDDAGAGVGPRGARLLPRRARLGAGGGAGRFSWVFVVDADGDRDGPARAVEIEDAAVHYSPSDRVRLGVGRMKIPVTFAESVSSNDIAFIERALPVDAFTDETLGPKVTNAQVWIHGRHHLVEAAVHLARDAAAGPEPDARAKKLGVTGRAAFAPVRNATKALHLGGWADRSAGPVDAARWGFGPELEAADGPALTGRRPDGTLASLVHGGLEAAWLDGPFWAQAEVMGGRFRRADRTDYAAGGWYAQVGYVAGGARGYDMQEGAWSPVAVTEAATAGGIGTVELALRYSRVDFGEPVNPTETRPVGGTGHAGRQSNVTAGVNWHLTGHSRLMFNVIHVDLDGAFGRRGSGAADGAPGSTAAPVTDAFRIYGMRWQYSW